jgi:NAD(P)-dependent dehydrogenase (short-subunit alcohol dehydrogenase family)
MFTGTTGLGAGFISLIAAHNPAKIFFSGRNKVRAEQLIAKLKSTAPTVEVIFTECDISSLASVQSAAKQFLTQTDRLDVLMCNAGVMAIPPALSKDGYEIQFATNHLGHALLIKMLLPLMLKTAEPVNSDVRIINMSSSAYSSTPKSGIEFDQLKTDQSSCGPIYAPSKFMRYGQSKLANLLYPAELARRYPSITSVAVHPGFIKTELHSNESFLDRQIVNAVSGGKWISVEEGPYTQTWAATTPKNNLVSGAYYEPIGVKTAPTTSQGRDMELAKRLFEWTEKELAAYQ